MLLFNYTRKIFQIVQPTGQTLYIFAQCKKRYGYENLHDTSQWHLYIITFIYAKRLNPVWDEHRLYGQIFFYCVFWVSYMLNVGQNDLHSWIRPIFKKIICMSKYLRK